MEHAEQYREEHTVTNLPRGDKKDNSNRLAERIIYYALGVIEALLGFSFVLKALGANPASSFVRSVYAVSAPFATPFQSIFGNSSAGAGSVIEWSLVIGMIVYLIVALGLVKLFRLIIKGGSRSMDDAA